MWKNDHVFVGMSRMPTKTMKTDDAGDKSDYTEMKQGTGSFMYKKPNPSRVAELNAARKRDKDAYDQWAARRPIGGNGKSGGELTEPQSRKILAIAQSPRFKKHGTMTEDELREYVTKPKPKVKVKAIRKPLSIERLREKRLAALGHLVSCSSTQEEEEEEST